MKKQVRLFLSSKAGRLVLASLAVWLLAAICFSWGQKREEEQAALAGELADVRAWEQRSGSKEASSFARTLVEPADPAEIEEDIRSLGISIDSVSEKENTLSREGGTASTFFTGRGTFGQICEAFAIIGKRKNWSTMDLREMHREGGALSFQAVILTNRSRGSYEKKEHRSHRPDGDREKPGGENTL